MMGVSANIDQDGRGADPGRIWPTARRRKIEGEPTLDVLKMKLADSADRSCLDHGSGLAHHWITSITIRQAELDSCRLDLASKAYRRGEVCGQRLIADQMKSGSLRQ